MRKCLTLVVIILMKICAGQSLFNNNLKNSVWIAEKATDGKPGSKEIALQKWSAQAQEPKETAVFWAFADSLVISARNDSSSKVLATYAYGVNDDDARLNIYTDEGMLTYGVGITSTGTYVILFRKKRKTKHYERSFQ